MKYCSNPNCTSRENIDIAELCKTCETPLLDITQPPKLRTVYCVNPDCTHRQNSAQLEHCQACQTSLVLQGRYQINRPICERPHAATELFNVIDLYQPESRLILKTLVSTGIKIEALFKQEQTLLIRSVAHAGIPQGRDAFAITLATGRILHCLVMAEIPGENLEEWIKQHGAIAQPQAIAWLKELLHILDYIHQQNIFHRDIKPANIMKKPDGSLVLIDFGTAREVTDTIINNRTNTAIVSYGYTPPEQEQGKAVLQSDFYALGKTFMHLLAGANFRSSNFVPKQAISPAFDRLLRDMTADKVGERPNTAKIILERLRAIETEPLRRRWQQVGWGFGLGTICGGLVMMPLQQIDWELAPDRVFPQATCDRDLDDRLSCGEQSLLSESGLASLLGKRIARSAQSKQEGIAYFRQQQWAKAQALMQQVWDESKDPEALVYLNNLKILTTPQLQARMVTIAVVIPVGKSLDAMKPGLNILRGVAQAQDRAVRSGLGLQVVLVDDGNDAQQATAVARELVQRGEIVAVIGHHVSDATLAALKIYDRAGMVLISPTSSSEELATYTLKQNNIFFRTVPSDRLTATFMTSFLIDRTAVRVVAVFYNPDKSYSRSLAGAFKETFQAFNGKIVSDDRGRFHLSCTGANCRRKFELTAAMNYARSQGAKAFVVIPDAAESQSNAIRDAFEILKAAGSDWAIVGDTMAGETALIAEQRLDPTIAASAWDPSADPNSSLVKFWAGSSLPISWHTHTTYNAASVVISAIERLKGQSIDRATLRATIADPQFSAIGAAGKIKFRDGTGELQDPKIALTKVGR